MGYLIKDTSDGASVTGTANVITISKLIPANSLTVGDVFEYDVLINKAVASNNIVTRVYVNTANNLTGATQIGQSTTSSGSTVMGRILYIKSATDTSLYQGTTNTFNPDTSHTLSINSANIDWTQSQYFIVALSHNAGTTNNSYSIGVLGLKR